MKTTHTMKTRIKKNREGMDRVEQQEEFRQLLKDLERSDRRFSVMLAVFFVLTVAGGVVVLAGVLL